MVAFFKDYYDSGNLHLSMVPDPRARANTSRHKFIVRRSMLRPEASVYPTEMRKLFPKEMTKASESGPSYILLSLKKETEWKEAQFPMLGRRIIYESAGWGSNVIRIPGEFSYISRYWEWTEDIIARCTKVLEAARVDNAVYASLYTYDRDPNIMRAFCESWCPVTNTLHTESGEWSISLWGLFQLGGLPVSGSIYDETIPSFANMEAREPDNSRLISRACQYLFTVYGFLAVKPDYKNGVRATQWVDLWCKKVVKHRRPPQRRPRGADSRPKNTHNPGGVITHRLYDWSADELSMFSDIGIDNEDDRRTTYLAAFLSCWLCVFVLPEHHERIIRPTTFEVATQMASGVEFSLAVPVLASIYRGLNKMTNSSNPSHSGSIFPAHYLYGWLAHYFDTHFSFDQPPIGPSMVVYSGHQCARSYTDKKARELIHTGSSIKPYRLIFSRNKRELLRDNNMLDRPRISYLISLRTGYLPLRVGNSFVLEPYIPTRFSRQFGFCQRIPSLLSRSEDGDEAISYDDALSHVRMLLFEGSGVEAVLPSYSLDWRDLITKSFKTWWAVTSVTDLRRDAHILISSVDPKPKDKPLEEGAKAQELCAEGTGESPIASVVPMKEACDRSSGKRTADSHSSDGESEANFRHCRNGKKNKTLVHPEPVGDNIFAGVSEFSDTPSQLRLDGDFDLAKEVPNSIDECNVVHPRFTPGRGKELSRLGHLSQNVAKSASRTHSIAESPSISHQSIEGPSSRQTLEKKAFCTTTNVRNRATPVASEFTIVPETKAVTGIVRDTLQCATSKLLRQLKDASFSEVESIARETRVLYRMVRQLGANPTGLQERVDSYTTAVQTFLHLQQAADGKRSSKDLEIELAQEYERLRKAKSISTAVEDEYVSMTRQKSSTENEIASTEREIASLEQKLDKARELLKLQVANLKDSEASRITAQNEVNAMTEKIADLEAVPSLTAEDAELLENYRCETLDMQSSLNPDDWERLIS